MDRFEKVICAIILACAIIAAVGQVSTRTQYSEKMLKHRLQYQQCLQGTDHRAVFADYRTGGK